MTTYAFVQKVRKYSLNTSFCTEYRPIIQVSSEVCVRPQHSLRKPKNTAMVIETLMAKAREVSCFSLNSIKQGCVH